MSPLDVGPRNILPARPRLNDDFLQLEFDEARGPRRRHYRPMRRGSVPQPLLELITGDFRGNSRVHHNRREVRKAGLIGVGTSILVVLLVFELMDLALFPYDEYIIPFLVVVFITALLAIRTTRWINSDTCRCRQHRVIRTSFLFFGIQVSVQLITILLKNLSTAYLSVL